MSGFPPEVGPTQGPGRVLRTPGRGPFRAGGGCPCRPPPPRLGRWDNAISLASPLTHAYLQSLTSQDNALCTGVWIIPVNSLVSVGAAVDDRGCGNVDNHGGASSWQVAGP